MKIGLIDYGRGNLRSVEKALQTLGADVRRVACAKELVGFDSIVLPGVGAFGDAMCNLSERGLAAPVLDWLKSGKPFLGICLGYQLLFEESEESPGVAGLGWIRGKVRRFPDSVGKVPHMGWNEVGPVNEGKELFQDLPEKPYFYHVHSYYPEPEDKGLAACMTDYGISFASGICMGNLAAFQFHPEKSQSNGLRLMGNFLKRIQS